MKETKALIFDFDGTLVDSLFLVKRILNQLAPKYRFTPITDEQLEMLRGKGPKEIIKLLDVSVLKIPFIGVDLKKEFQKNLASVSLIEGIREALGELDKQGFVLGVLTSNGKDNVESFLKMNQLHCMDFVYGDVGLFGKSGSIKKVLQENGILREDAWYVGDEIRDIQAAKKAGVKIISVSWGFNTHEALKAASPDFIASSPKELRKIVS